MSEALGEWVAAAAAVDRWSSRRGLGRVRPGIEAGATMATIDLAAADPAGLVLTELAGGDVGAVTTLMPKPMESRCFGFPTAVLSNVLSPAAIPGRRTTVERLLAGSLAVARDLAVELVLLRVDADDVDTLVAAQAAGFTVHETTITFLVDSTHAAQVPPPDPSVVIERYEADVSGALPVEWVQQLADRTAQWDLGHFRADPLIPQAGVEAFYREMIDNLVQGRWSDTLFVARYDGRVVGLESEVSDRLLLSHLGIDVRSAEWFMVLEPGLGVGRELAAAAARQPHPGGTLHSWETQARNLSTIRCIEQTRIAHPVRSSHTLHAWPQKR